MNVCAGYTNHFVLCPTHQLLISRDNSFGGLPHAGRPDLDPQHSDSASDDDVGAELAKRKPREGRAAVSHDCTDSDSLESDDLVEESQ